MDLMSVVFLMKPFLGLFFFFSREQRSAALKLEADDAIAKAEHREKAQKEAEAIALRVSCASLD